MSKTKPRKQPLYQCACKARLQMITFLPGGTFIGKNQGNIRYWYDYKQSRPDHDIKDQYGTILAEGLCRDMQP